MVSSAVFSDLNGDGLPELISLASGADQNFLQRSWALDAVDAPVTFGSHSSTLSEFTAAGAASPRATLTVTANLI